MPKSKRDLESLAQAVSDDESVDWSEAAKHAEGDDQDLVDALETISEVTSKLRELQDELDPADDIPVLESGARWGSLEIVGRIGQGASADVYEARDPHVGRAVALKLLRDAALSPSARDSVVREAQLLARVSHPNVATVYGADTHDGRTGIWMEYLRGRTLEKMLDDGPLSAKEATSIGIDVLGALAAAHSEGVIHRDVKAQNLMREAGGRIVLMDFGIGRDQRLASEMEEHIVGTPFYVAPEVFRGEPESAQSDIYSVGVLLFHLVTNRFPIEARNVTELKEQHRRGEGRLLRDLRPGLPEDFVVVVERALDPDPAERYPSAGAMDRALLHSLGVISTASMERGGGRRTAKTALTPFLLGGAVAAALAVAAISWLTRDVTPPDVLRFNILLAADQELDLDWGPSIALSPQGDAVVYEDEQQLYYRPLSSFEAQLIPGSELPYNPFFSPDGEWIGFFTNDNKLKRVPVAGGNAITICDAVGGRGSSASWGVGDTIVFTDYTTNGLLAVNAQGGLPEPVTTPDHENGELRHAFPAMLPDGKSVLFSIITADFRVNIVGALSLETGAIKRFESLGTSPLYLSPGHLVFARAGSLFAARFDAETLTLEGPPARVLEGVTQSLSVMRPYGSQYTLSANGTLAYIPAMRERSLMWVDRDGSHATPAADAGRYTNLRLSPDGTMVAAEMIEVDAAGIWVIDLTRGGRTRLTSDGEDNHFPIWTSGGEEVAFCTAGDGEILLRSAPADGSRLPIVLARSPERICPSSWSPHHEALIVSRLRPETRGDVLGLDVSANDGVQPITETRDWEWQARLSPDGAWIAYASEESYRTEVYVQPYPGPGGRTRVSLEGGSHPVWSTDGRELFFLEEETVMVVEVTLGARFTASRPEALFVADAFELESDTSFDVSTDGRRFLMIDRGPPRRNIHVVANWRQDVENAVAAPR